MIDGKIKTELEALRPRDPVTIIDGDGARIAGTVEPRRVGIDPDDELGIRRSTGVVTWVKHSRIAEIERGS